MEEGRCQPVQQQAALHFPNVQVHHIVWRLHNGIYNASAVEGSSRRTLASEDCLPRLGVDSLGFVYVFQDTKYSPLTNMCTVFLNCLHFPTRTLLISESLSSQAMRKVLQTPWTEPWIKSPSKGFTAIMDLFLESRINNLN